jgi:hypothetical protein
MFSFTLDAFPEDVHLIKLQSDEIFPTKEGRIMKTWKAFCAIIAVLALIAGVAWIGPVSAAGDEATPWDQFQQCKISCNEGYGGLDIFPPAVRGGGAQGWANCVLKCERNYWKDVDRDTKDLQ